MTAAPPPAVHSDEVGGASPGPGRLLRAARESAGIGLRDVAAQMHLDDRTMTALENDAFSELPAPTFVRGYLRGYARLLSVPVGPVMEAYDREGFTPPELVADIAEKPQANSGDFPVRMTTYVVVLALTALVVLWWHNQGYDDPVAMSPAPLAAPETTPAPRPLVPAVATPVTPVPPASPRAAEASATANTAAVPATQARPQQTEPVAPPTPGMAAALRRDGAPAATDASAGMERRVEQVLSEAEHVLARTRGEIDAAARKPAALPAPASQARPDAAAASPPPVSATGGEAVADVPAPARSAEPAAAAGKARLRLRFPEQAWVEVYDRNDQRLFYNLAAAGRELDLQGDPPIRVLLGRTRGVSVEYNGQPVDVTPHTERGVARFTLGQ